LSFIKTHTHRISSFVVDQLQADYPQSDTGVAYIYCDYRDQASHCLALAAAVILRQLLAKKTNIPASMHTLFEKCRRNGSPALYSELISILLELQLQFERCFLVIDAVDEFDVVSSKNTNDFLRALKDLASKGFKVFITGRSLPEAPWLSEATVIRIDAADTQRDINAYISQSVKVFKDEDSLSEILDEALEAEIANKLTAQAHGM
jgi:hypothetical protein